MQCDLKYWIFIFPKCTFRKNIITLVLITVLGSLLLICNPLYSLNFVTVNHITIDEKIRFPYHNIQKQQRNIQKQPKKSQIFTIHIWKHGQRIKRRFLRSYSHEIKNPYKYCSVNNCIVSTNDSNVYNANAVLFHLHQTKGPHTLPKYHPSNQIWIFFTDESPYNTFYVTRKYTISDYNGKFNWSMTYRMDSDVPVPYGRTVSLTPSEKEHFQVLPNYAKSKNLTVAILGSNCGGINYRWQYVAELQKYVQVDVYGNCGHLKCPGHFMKDCPVINNYKFYLAFENSNCKEYLTEKLWWNAYQKSAVPIVMGSIKSDYEKLCPPRSFIHVEDFASPYELAEYIKLLDANDTAYNQYFEWKKQFKVLNEHGYFGSPSLHLCRICETLNKKFNESKVYNDLESFWSANSDCYVPQWTPAQYFKWTRS